MQIFGYFYYKFSSPYKKWEGDYYYQVPIILLSMCQTNNLFLLMIFIFKFNMCDWLYYIVLLLVLLLNQFIFLTRQKREYYEKKWEYQTTIKKRLGIALAILYIMISFISFFLVVINYSKYVGWDWNLNCSWRWW